MRWIIRFIFVVVLLAVPAMGAFFLIPADKIAEIASQEISVRTGRQVRFDGNIRPSFYPVLGVKIGGLTIANADWSNGPPMLRAKSALIGVAFLPLLSGIVKVTDFRLVDPVILLERARDGRVNWAIGGKTSSPANGTDNAGKPEGLPRISLGNGQIIGGTVTYIDRKAGSEWQFRALDLAVKAPKATGAARLSGSLRLRGQPLSFQFKITNLATFLSGDVTGLTASATGNFGAVTATGRAGFNPPEAEMELVAKTQNPTAIAQLAGLPKTIFSGLFRTAVIRGKLTYANGKTIYVRNADILVDTNRLSGNIDLTLGNRPRLEAKMTAGDLDLSGIASLGSGPAATPRAKATTGWSTATLDMGGLGLFDADVVFSANSANLGSMKTGQLKLRARLSQGRLSLDLDRIAAYGGNIGGRLVLNTRKGLSVAGNITGKALQLRPLLSDLTGYDRLSSKAGFKLNFRTSGSNMDTMMKRLSGRGRVDIGAGEIIGFDLMGMLRNLDTSYRGLENKTIFSSITGSYTISGGVLTNNDLIFNGALVKASGKGRLDIGQRKIDYRITPVAFSNQKSGGISVPVLITGSWSNISLRPDLNGLLDAKLQKQKKAAEAKVRSELQKAKKKAEDNLRSNVQKAIEGNMQKSLTDALKRLSGQN